MSSLIKRTVKVSELPNIRVADLSDDDIILIVDAETMVTSKLTLNKLSKYVNNLVVDKDKISELSTLDGESTDLDQNIQINKMIDIFRSMISMLILCILPLGVFAGDIPTLPGTPKNVIPGNTRLYTKDDVDTIVDEAIGSIVISNITYNIITNIYPTTIITNIPEVITNRYPMFIIPLNDAIPNYIITKNSSNVVTNIELDSDDPYSTTEFTSIELKASTNNFYHASSDHVPGFTNEHDKVLFWCASAFKGSSYATFNSMNDMRTFACNGITQYGDNRSWHQYVRPDIELYNPFPRYITVIVDYKSMVDQHEDAEWLHDHNDEIVWSYVRFTVDSIEKVNNSSLWTVCYPIKWFNELPNWALTNGEVRIIRDL